MRWLCEAQILIHEWNGKKLAGLVCWKDRDIVYCLSNKCNTKETDVCRRRSKEGLLTIARPKMISEYNRYMGGVDLADMQRLHCNLTIMGQNRWWLKLFFICWTLEHQKHLCCSTWPKGMDRKQYNCWIQVRIDKSFSWNTTSGYPRQCGRTCPPLHWWTILLCSLCTILGSLMYKNMIWCTRVWSSVVLYWEWTGGARL